MDSAAMYSSVREHYSTAAQTKNDKYGEAVARSFGYSAEDLLGASGDANLGLSCGNPLATASLKEGETVVDLGSGAGFDAFLASPKVGATGRVIGIDMNDDMLARANKIKADRGTENVTFIKGEITSIPLESNSADCIISNCVINLVPEAEKALVFKEMARVLKPGGRIAISDILAKKPLPDDVRADAAMYVGCISGASLVSAYEAFFEQAGFSGAVIADTNADLNVYAYTDTDGSKKNTCCSGGSNTKTCGSGLPSSSTMLNTDLNQWVGSYKIYAVKGQ